MARNLPRHDDTPPQREMPKAENNASHAETGNPKSTSTKPTTAKMASPRHAVTAIELNTSPNKSNVTDSQNLITMPYSPNNTINVHADLPGHSS
jgi:hypothetical protein